MLIRFWLLGLIFVVGGCATTLKDPAFELAQQGGQVEAYRLKLERETRQNPTDPVVAYKLAWLLRKLGQPRAAWPSAQKAMTLSPLLGSYKMLAGLIQQDLGDHFQAVNLLSAALKLDRRLLEAYLGLAKSFVETGRINEAISQLNTAIQIEPLYFAARLARVKAKMLLQKGQSGLLEKNKSGLLQKDQSGQISTESLQKEMELALKVKPGSAPGTLLLAQLYQTAGADLKAQLLLETWLQNYGQQDQILVELTKFYLRTGQLKKAKVALAKQKKPNATTAALQIRLKQGEQSLSSQLSEIQSQLKVYPASLQLHLFEGQTLLGLGRLDQAERKLQTALSLEPKSVDAYLSLAQVYRAESDYVAEQQSLDSAEQLAPSSLPVILAVTKSYLHKGLYTQAARKLDLRKKGHEDREVWILKAQIALAQHKFRQAARWIKEAEKLGQDDDSARAWAVWEIGQGAVRLGIKRLKPLLAKKPNDLRTQLILAQAYLKINQPQRTLALLRPLLGKKVGLGKAQLWAARARLNLGQVKQSVQLLAKALRVWPRDPDLVQLYTAELGFLGRWNQAIPLLEEMMLFKHHYNQLFSYRLWEFYQKSGNRKKFRSFRLPGEL